ncbi:MAG: hemagglutinin, partial [Veillonella sp.]|nr:hemagglutinin [Veillonella sp.]
GTNAAGGKEYIVGLGNTINVGTAHPVTVDGNAGHVTGLQNTDWNVDNPVAVPGRAATEDQLKKVNDTVNANKDQIDKNKQAIADNKQNITTNAGNIANNTQNIAKNAGDIVTINKTIEKGLNFDGDSGATINKKLGDTVAVKGGATGTLSDNNIGVVSDGTGTLNVKLAKTLTGLDSVTAGDTTINNGGLTVGGKNYVSPNGINANDQKVTNVANGDVAPNSKDAVNGGQLHQVKQDLGDQITNTKNDLNNKIDNTKTDLINKGLRFNADNDDEKTNKLGSKVTVNGDDNITTEITQTGDDTKIALKLKKDLNVRSVTATDTVKAGDVTMGKQADGANPGNTGNYITGLDNKTWDPGNVVSGRAATEDQLKQALANQTATGLKFDANVGGVQTSKLGSTVIVQGEGKAADSDYSGENIKTFIKQDAATGNTTIDVKMSKNLKAESVKVGKGDNKDGVSITGPDG